MLSAAVSEEAVMPGSRLPEGDTTDKGMDRLSVCLSKILEPKPANTKKTWLEDIADLLDPTKNPGSFRMCQDAVVSREVIGPLCSLAQDAPIDSVRSLSLEVLARLCFGNGRAAVTVASHDGVLCMVRSALTNGQQPEQLSALQLAQAIAAGPSPDVHAAVTQLVVEVAPHQSSSSSQVVSEAALDVLVSCSFHCPAQVATAVSWPLLAAMVSEDDTVRPSRLQADPLSVLTCGLLASNLLNAPASEDEDSASAKTLMATRLADGHFIEYFLLATQAAAERREWPQGSCAFHSPKRLAAVVSHLSLNGYGPRLVGAVKPLAQIVESSPDEEATCQALRALHELCRDVSCLLELLGLAVFRSETLEALCSSGEEKDAVELASYLAGAENMLSAAQALLDASVIHCAHAPSVSTLAELFARLAPLDSELDKEQVLELVRVVPLAPSAAVRASLSGAKALRFSFQNFAEHIYGAPTVCGWWPSLMEDTAALWGGLAVAHRVPDLTVIVSLFELGAKGGTKVDGDVLLSEVLPAAGLPAQGDTIEGAFTEIVGEVPLDFPAFAKWLSWIYADLARAEMPRPEESC